MKDIAPAEIPAIKAKYSERPVKTEILYGIHPVREALKAARRGIFEVYIAQEKASGRLEKLTALSGSRSIAVKTVKGLRLKQLTGTAQHQGVAARVSPFPLKDISAIGHAIGSADRSDFLVLLDNVLDPQNLGAIIRTAVAVGVGAVIIPKKRSASPTPAVSRASAGALEHVFLARVTNMVNTIKILKEKGVWIFGMDPAATDSIYAVDLTGAAAIVIGGEEKGLRPLVKKHCDSVISIPQAGPVNSLNASTAAAVVMYEAFRQRRCGYDKGV
ncbi:MAG: 23S rRNA (guanosine(2251)-2'-O)-methyltransferase RlmB [Desulfobacterales bacterium]